MTKRRVKENPVLPKLFFDSLVLLQLRGYTSIFFHHFVNQFLVDVFLVMFFQVLISSPESLTRCLLSELETSLDWDDVSPALPSVLLQSRKDGKIRGETADE